MVAGARGVLTGERIFAGAFVAAGILCIAEGIGYGFIRADGIIGPGFIPIIAGAVLTVLGSGIVLQTFRSTPEHVTLFEAAELAAESDVSSLESDSAPVFDVEGNQRSAAIVFVGIGLALALSNWLGLIISLTILVFLILLFVEKQGLVTSFVAALLMGFGSWLVFVHFLEVPLGFGIFSP